jgi:hypothetical protein
MKKLIASLALLAIAGAGCPNAPASTPEGQGNPSHAVPTRMGFGKLPGIDAGSKSGAPLGTAGTLSMTRDSAMAVPAPATAPAMEMAVGSGGGGMMQANTTMGVSDAMIARPIPNPPGLKPVAIKYDLTASLPEWGSESDVLEVQRPDLDVSMVRGFASAARVPSQLVSGISDVQYVNVSWKDTDGYVWSTDGSSGMLSWWNQGDSMKPMADNQPSQKPATATDDQLINAAVSFLRSHGLGSVADQGASVERYDQPCIMREDVPAADMMKAEPATEAGSGVSTMIYPSPCGYYPVQANVYFGAMREGKTVVDMGGWPSRMSSVNVDMGSLKVTGGNVVYSESIARSSYPLLDKDTVMKRLQEGGRNPVYPWGSETKDIQVTIDKVELAWLRFDSWQDNRQQTYFIPAIAASGHVNRNIKGQEPEEYHTTVALVTDDSFGGDVTPQPVPMPYMMEGSTGASGGEAGSAVTPPPVK